ncbi:MAG: glycosyltransferase family 1 protein [Microbacteriaceae bacterium]|nr:glycosyltransferase family 1 protein [Microbacteriaceae bacterium]NBS61042.1 glycosyltransferase family 1 protein [Microbacteriaceae bacterium]
MSFKKVLVVSQLPPPVNGSTLMTKTLVEQLGKLGIDTCVISKSFSKDSDEIGKKYASKILKIPRFLLGLVSANIKFSPKLVIYFLTNRVPSFYLDFLALSILRMFRANVVLYLHTSGYEKLIRKSKLNAALCRSAFSWADKLVTLSPKLSSDITQFVPELKIHSIANAVEDQFTLKSKVLPRKRFENKQIIFVGNLVEGKGYEEFLDASLKLRRKGLISKALIIGAETKSGQILDMRKRVSQMSYENDVKILGPRSREEISRYLSESSVFVFPTTYEFEAQPLVIVEALSAGLPVVALGAGAIPDFFAIGQIGELLEPRQARDLADAIARTLDDFDKWLAMSLTARKVYSRNHSMASYRKAWVDLLAELGLELEK